MPTRHRHLNRTFIRATVRRPTSVRRGHARHLPERTQPYKARSAVPSAKVPEYPHPRHSTPRFLEMPTLALPSLTAHHVRTIGEHPMKSADRNTTVLPRDDQNGPANRSRSQSPRNATPSRKRLQVTMAALMLLTTTSAIAAERTISTGDELQLAISDHGTLEAVAIADKQLLPQNLKAFQPVSICDVTLGQEFVPVGGESNARKRRRSLTGGRAGQTLPHHHRPLRGNERTH